MALENFNVVISTFDNECVQIITFPNNCWAVLISSHLNYFILEKMRIHMSLVKHEAFFPSARTDTVRGLTTHGWLSTTEIHIAYLLWASFSAFFHFLGVLVIVSDIVVHLFPVFQPHSDRTAMRMSFWRWSISSIPSSSLAMQASFFPATATSLALFNCQWVRTAKTIICCYS